MFKEIQNDGKAYKNLVEGAWNSSKENKTIEIKSPLNGNTVGFVPAVSQAETDEIMWAAKTAQPKWRNTPVHERAKILYKTADILEEQVEVLAEVLLLEIGKDLKSARSEVVRTADYIRFVADSAKNMHGESLAGDSFPGFDRNKISIVTREPLGVVLAISPFNYPINLAASKIAPALVAGNTVVFKPATQGAISGLYLARVFQQAGIPAGVLNTITGYGREIGDYVVAHPQVDFINFTGSTAVGQRIAKLVTMKPLLLELGGKDAAIVLADADLELAADNIVSGAYSYSGQRCTAVKRVLVQESVADRLVAMLKERVDKLQSGNPLQNPDAVVVPLIDSKAADFVMSLILGAEQAGAKVLAGGHRTENFIQPTLLDYVTTEMALAWEEPFGPVLPVIRVKDKDEAISIANRSDYGLQSSVFTSSIDEAFYVANRLEVGTVQVNNKTERGPDHFPFLGIKSSGIGVQGIRYSIEAMSRPKAIVINTH